MVLTYQNSLFHMITWYDGLIMAKIAISEDTGEQSRQLPYIYIHMYKESIG